jgi:saccharopine dehydrogenase-like NADP-dependent oxidoreductase
MDASKHIVLFGAGKSATDLIDFLTLRCGGLGWHLTVVDTQEAFVLSKTLGRPGTSAVGMDIQAEGHKRFALVRQADVVISMMPPALHQLIASDCLTAGRHLLTASYTDPAMRAMAPAIKEKGLLFLCEMGLDPGIDHMSAMQAIRGIQENGGEILAFRSHCGGLVAPESDDNPWHYKISWNPRNIVLAGKAGAFFREDGVDRHLLYGELFDPQKLVTVPDLGLLSWYPNRDSLAYAALYGLDRVPTFVRTTLRHPAFSSGWKNVVALQLTDEASFYDTRSMSLAVFFRTHFRRFGWSEWLNANGSLGTQLGTLLRLSPREGALLEQQLLYLGWNSGELINRGMASAADVLQFILETKLALQPQDKDMVVMLHEIRYRTEGKTHEWQGSLVVKGSDALHTAMARTVGLPLGIAAILLLQERITVTGLHIPTIPEIYEPVLQHLEAEGIVFQERTM